MEEEEPGCLMKFLRMSFDDGSKGVDVGGPSRTLVSDSFNYYLDRVAKVMEGGYLVPLPASRSHTKLFYAGKIVSYGHRQGMMSPSPPLPSLVFKMVKDGSIEEGCVEDFLQRRPGYRMVKEHTEEELLLNSAEDLFRMKLERLDQCFEIDIIEGQKAVPLVKGGQWEKVEVENYDDFLRLASEKVLPHSFPMFKVLANGLREHVSPRLLSELSADDLEVMDLKGGLLQLNYAVGALLSGWLLRFGTSHHCIFRLCSTVSRMMRNI